MRFERGPVAVVVAPSDSCADVATAQMNPGGKSASGGGGSPEHPRPIATKSRPRSFDMRRDRATHVPRVLGHRLPREGPITPSSRASSRVLATARELTSRRAIQRRRCTAESEARCSRRSFRPCSCTAPRRPGCLGSRRLAGSCRTSRSRCTRRPASLDQAPGTRTAGSGSSARTADRRRTFPSDTCSRASARRRTRAESATRTSRPRSRSSCALA